MCNVMMDGSHAWLPPSHLWDVGVVASSARRAGEAAARTYEGQRRAARPFMPLDLVRAHYCDSKTNVWQRWVQMSSIQSFRLSRSGLYEGQACPNLSENASQLFESISTLWRPAVMVCGSLGIH